MTFYEAAIQILKRAGRPLHYRKITELAIRDNLLSHIGKTPDVTMQARLNQEAQKEAGGTIARIRPGVFALVEGVQLVDVKETVTQPPPERLEESEVRAGTPGTAGSPIAPSLRSRTGVSLDAPQATPSTGPEGVGDRIKVRPTTLQPPPPEAGTRQPAGMAPSPRGFGPVLPSLVEAAIDLLKRSEAPLGTQDLARQLSKARGRPVPRNVLELTLRSENERRMRQSLRPMFVLLGAGWSLIDDTIDRHLTTHWAAMERAHGQINRVTVDTLAKKIESLPAGTLEIFLASLLEGLGYRTRVLDRRDDAVTLEAITTSAIVPLKIAVRLWHSPARLPAEAVAALRGQLHRYGATHGVFVIPRSSDVDTSALDEAASNENLPILILDAEALAPLAVKAGIGVLRYALTIPILDATWFA